MLNGGEEHNGKKPNLADNFESSIEISFTTINDKKIKLIGEYGFKRVSAGIQSMSRTLLEKQGRAYNNVFEISEYMKAMYREGVEKINFDLMYGMPDQNDDMIDG
ncbi:MAG: hypothetical protein Q4D29_11815, partial [Lachnospiraceae bacterium]|nr:hypothetical protein [Lachnospiraceae bacterium]